MRLIRWMFAGVVAAGLASGCSREGPQVSVDPARVRLGEPITVSFEDAPGNRRDWIGLYKAGESDTHRYLTYLYTGDGATAGQVTFDRSEHRNKLPPGEYEAKLFLDNGYKELASARFWIITTTDGGPLVSLAKPRIKAGEPVNIHWASAPERAWIEIYKADQFAQVVIEYRGIATDGEVTFNADDFKVALQPGNYRVRLMSKDRVAELASAPFRVLDPNAGPRVTVATDRARIRRAVGGVVEELAAATSRTGSASTRPTSPIPTATSCGSIPRVKSTERSRSTSSCRQASDVAKLLVDNGYVEVGVSEPFTVTAQ